MNGPPCVLQKQIEKANWFYTTTSWLAGIPLITKMKKSRFYCCYCMCYLFLCVLAKKCDVKYKLRYAFDT